jgi:hypothetical protein
MVLPITLLVVLAISTSGDQLFFVFLLSSADNLIKIEDKRKRLAAASPVMIKSWGPSWGGVNQLPGKRPRETAET